MKATVRFFIKHLKSEWKVASLLFFMLNIRLVLDTVTPIFFGRLVDTASADPKNYSGLMVTAMTILAINVIAGITRTVFDFSMVVLEPRIMKNMLDESQAYLMRHSQSFFANEFAGALVKKVIKLSASFEEIFDRLAFEFYPTVVQIILTLIIIYFVNPFLAGMLFIYSIVFLTYNFIILKFKVKLDNRVNEEDSSMTGLLADIIGNASSVALFSAQERERRKFEEKTERVRKAQVKTWGFGNGADVFLRVISIGTEFGLMYFSISYISQGIMSIGDFVVIQTLLIRLYNYLWSVGWVTRGIGRGFSNAREMIQILETPHEISDAPDAQPLVASKGDIEVSNLTFGYKENCPVFQKLNLRIKGGKKIALVSTSGGGKSTFINLLTRMHNTPGDSIFIDGQDITQVTLDSLRSSIAFVPQDPALFHRSLGENIAFGRPSATPDEIITAAKKAHCHDFIMEQPEGYDTLVGERGIKLSGGQRQRIAIARALLVDAPILILDEATSALDSETESLIQAALHEVMVGRTTIAIAHRLSTISEMDEIIVLEGGCIIERGTHEELLRKKNGLYAKLWNMQSGGYVAID